MLNEENSSKLGNTVQISKISKSGKYGCKMLKNTKSIALRNKKILFKFVLRTKKRCQFIHDMPTSHGHIFQTSHYFATKFSYLPNFEILFLIVLIKNPSFKLSLIREWSIYNQVGSRGVKIKRSSHLVRSRFCKMKTYAKYRVLLFEWSRCFQVYKISGMTTDLLTYLTFVTTDKCSWIVTDSWCIANYTVASNIEKLQIIKTVFTH